MTNQTQGGAVATTRRTIAEFAIALGIVLAIVAFNTVVQPRINVNQGRGYDGMTYHRMAELLARGLPPSGETQFVNRIGTPFLATLADPSDLVNGFLVVNTWATLISSLLLLVWFRTHLQRPWLRVGLVVLYASHWLQLVRFTYFYPVLTDACAQVCCFAGLNCISWYERRPGVWPATMVLLISVVGVFFRELVLLVPLAFLFARNPSMGPSSRFPFFLARNLPRVEQWVALVAACAVLIWISSIVVASDPEFRSTDHVMRRAFDRRVVTFSLGWMVAFAPVLFIVLFDWRSAAEYLSRHRALLVFLIGVAGLGWAASLESERHALNWSTPIVYVLFGLTIERHTGWFRSPGLLGLLLVSQMLVGRFFLTIPQPDDRYLEFSPLFLLTPIGQDATYLHLFPDYLPPTLAWVQFVEFAVLWLVVVLWLGRCASNDSRTSGRTTARQAPVIGVARQGGVAFDEDA